MEEYCKGILDEWNGSNTNVWEDLHPTAQKFMQSLKLSHIHPTCLSSFVGRKNVDLSVIVGDGNSSNNYYYPGENDMLQKLITLGWQVLPSLLAMGELWLRLFAFIIAPLSITYLISKQTTITTGNEQNVKKDKNDDSRREEKLIFWIILVGMASSAVIATDSLYVYEYGRTYGAWLFGCTLCLSLLAQQKFLKNNSSNSNSSDTTKFVYYSRFVSQVSTLSMLLLVVYLWIHSAGSDSDQYGRPGLDVPTIEEGLYYSKSNDVMSKVAKLWPEESRTYNTNNATPYLPTGDSKTGIPFLVNPMPMNLQFHRVWVPIPEDKEAVALEIAFSKKDGSHRQDKAVYLILHGLNGGTQEAYVRDFVERRTEEGHTCIIMIARGLMDTPIVGWNVFHGARVTDVDAAARAVKKALSRNKKHKQKLAGVGYSMGAIVLSNYVARSGTKCHLDMAMAVSGGLDMREQINFDRSKRLWQPMLAKELREKFIIGKFDPRYRHRLSGNQYLHLMRSYSISDIDKNAVVTYNGFDNLLHYYTEMSAMGDTSKFKRNNTRDSSREQEKDDGFGRISDVSIPFCVLHALDDPLVTWRTMGHDPETLVNSGSGFIMMALTKRGGHVGWPLGLLPHQQSWKFMNDAVRDFTESVIIATTK